MNKVANKNTPIKSVDKKSQVETQVTTVSKVSQYVDVLL